MAKSFSIGSLGSFEKTALSNAVSQTVNQPSVAQSPVGFTGSAPLTIAGIAFADFSIPQLLQSLGGIQAVAVHQFPGGIRTSQSFGAFPAPLSWKGTFLGTNAFYYASAIDQLRVKGQEVDVEYSTFKLKGVITHFFMQPKNQWVVPYTIELIIIEDKGGASAYVNAAPAAEALLGGLAQQLNLLSAGAPNGYIFPTALSGLFSAMSSMTGTLLGQFGGLVTNIPLPLQQAIFNGVGYAVTAGQMFTNGSSTASILAFGAAELPAISALSQLAGLSNFSTPVVNAVSSVFGLITPSITAIAGLFQNATAQSAISDSMNIASQSTALLNPNPATAQQVQTVNPNLFSMASQYYSDPSLWSSIAQANGLLNPAPVGQYNLVVPQQ